MLIDNINVNKTVVSNKISFGKNDLKDAKKFEPMHIPFKNELHIEKVHVFFIKDEKLLEKHNEIWKNVSNIIQKEFESNPIYNEKYIKTKIKFYNGKPNTTFHNNKIPKQRSKYISLSQVFKRRSERIPNVLCTFNLRPVSKKLFQ